MSSIVTRYTEKHQDIPEICAGLGLSYSQVRYALMQRRVFIAHRVAKRKQTARVAAGIIRVCVERQRDKRNAQMTKDIKNGMTLAEAGRKYNLSRQRVHQILRGNP